MSVLDQFMQFVSEDSDILDILKQQDFINETHSMMPDFHMSNPLERCFNEKPQSASANLLIEHLLSSPQPPAIQEILMNVNLKVLQSESRHWPFHKFFINFEQEDVKDNLMSCTLIQKLHDEDLPYFSDGRNVQLKIENQCVKTPIIEMYKAEKGLARVAAEAAIADNVGRDKGNFKVPVDYYFLNTKCIRLDKKITDYRDGAEIKDEPHDEY